MAGSYNHVVTKKGKLRAPDDLLGMLEARGRGDVYEAVEEMYGMIWFLAHEIGIENGSDSPEFVAKVVEEARLNYREGLEKSPGVKR